MGPFTLPIIAKGSSLSSPDVCTKKTQNSLMKKSFASVSMGDEKPFDLPRTLFEGVIAGGTAGVVVETALYPIDTIKTRLQAARGGEKLILRGLYSGLAGNLAGVLAASALFVGVYEPIKQKLLRIFPDSAIGGIAASLICVPTEVVKQRMQTGQFTSASGAVRFIASKEGFRGLYAGYGSFLLRDLPFDAIQFCIYEQLRIGYMMADQLSLKLAQREQRVTEERNIKIFIAQMHVVKGDLEEGLKRFQDLIDENPRDFRPYLCQGIIYSLLDKKEEAAKQFETYQSLVPEEFPQRGFLDDVVFTAKETSREQFHKEFKSHYSHRSDRHSVAEEKS